MPDPSDYLNLYSGNEDVARQQVAELAKQIRQRRAMATLGMLTGDPAMSDVGKEIGGQADRMDTGLLGVAQHRSQQQIEQQRYGPSKALGGLSPEEYQAITHRKMLGKLMINPLVNGGLSPAYGPPPTPPTGNDSLLSPEAIDQSANLYLKTGQLPSLGRANPLLHGAILKRAAELSGGSDIATNRANLKADTGSLAKAQQQADAIESFENTALKNLDQFRQVASGVVDTGSPFFNKPLRSVMQKFAGDPRMAQFNAARQVAVQEIGKVLGGAVQGGAITDSQRHEVEGLLSGDMSLAQIDAVSRTLKQDMANRKASVAAQLGTIRGRISGGGAPATTEAPPTKRRRYNPATGQIEGP